MDIIIGDSVIVNTKLNMSLSKPVKGKVIKITGSIALLDNQFTVNVNLLKKI